MHPSSHDPRSTRGARRTTPPFRRSLFAPLVLLALAAPVIAQQPPPTVQPDVRLSIGLWPLGPREPGLFSSRRPQFAVISNIVTGQNYVIAAWEEFIDGEWAIVYKRGGYGFGEFGSTWLSDGERLDTLGTAGGSATGKNSVSPRVAANEIFSPYVVWREIHPDGEQIVFSRSTSLGQLFNGPNPVAPKAKSVSAPQISVAGLSVFIVWTQSDDTIPWQQDDAVYLAASDDGGVTFDVIRLDDPTLPNAPEDGLSSAPSVACLTRGGTVYVAWTEFLASGVADVRFRKIVQWGQGTQPDTQTLGSAGEVFDLQLTVVDTPVDGVLAAWLSDFSCIASSWSADQGVTFQAQPDICLPQLPDQMSCLDGGPGVAVFADMDLAFDEVSGRVFAVFTQSLDMCADPLLVHSRIFDPAGAAWEPTSWPISLANSAPDENGLARAYPQLATAGGMATVVWMEMGSGFGDAYDIKASVTSTAGDPGWSVPVSVTSKAAPGPGEADARSGFPQLLALPTQAAIVWDDRRNRSLPSAIIGTDPYVTHASIGAPDVYYTVIEF